MSSQLRVDNILPSAGTALGIGTVSGSITFNSNISGDTIFNNDVTVNGVLTYEDVTNIDSVGVITARSDVSIADKIIHTGDTNTAIRFPAADTFSVETGGSERLRITSDGNLVINGASPNHDASSGSIFLIPPSGNPNRGIKWSDTSDTHYVKLEPSVIDGLTINGYSGVAFATGSRTNSTWAERVRISSTGNVGINQTSPDKLLHISSSSAPTIRIENTSAGAQVGNLVGSLEFEGQDNNAAGVRAKIDAEYRGVGAATAIKIHTAWENETTLYESAYFTKPTIKFTTNNVERLRITSAGLIGVGTINPSLTGSSPNGIHIAGGNAALKLQNTNNGDWAFVEYADESNTTKFIQGYRDSSGVYSIRPGTSLNATSGISLTSDGLMGLGTNNPSSYVGGGENLVIADSSDAGMTIASGTSNSGTINFADGSSGDARYRGRVEYSHSLDALDILTAATTQIRIDNSGRVLLGTLNSTGTQLIKVNGDTNGTTYGGHIALTQGRTSPGNGATHGVLSFGTETRPEVVKVVSFVDGTWTDGQYHPSGLYIATTDYNRNSPTEKIRITDIGEVNCYSTGSVIQAGTLQGGGYNAYFYEGRRNQNTGGTRTYIVWSNGNVQNTNNSYGSISDQRLKENIVDATSQWDDIKSLQIRKYNFRESTGNETHTQIGLIAQEAESVSPGLVQTTAVSEGEVLQDADGNQIESVKSINYSVLYMKSVKALQEAQTRIEALEAAVAALQGS